MPEDAGRVMKDRLRADLRTAMTERRTVEAKVIRGLIAAIDNAEAPPASVGQTARDHAGDPGRPTEVERLLLTRSDVRQVLLAEILEREHPAAELERVGQTDRADAVRAEARLARGYVG